MVLTSAKPIFIVFLITILFTPTYGARASHDGDGSYDTVEEYSDWFKDNSSKYRRNTKKLDNKIVEEIYIPILFGVFLDDLSPNFGDPRGGGTRTHEGEDIMAPEGIPVVSPTRSVVLKTGSGASSGKYVYTTNPGGETFVYMHLSSIADINPGDLLEVGDYIGMVGDTGNANGVDHLHFEIRKNGALDPYSRIQKEFNLEDKIDFLDAILDDIRRDDELAQLLVELYRDTFIEARSAGIDVPMKIEAQLGVAGGGAKAVQATSLLEQFQALLRKIPVVVNSNLENGAESSRVSLIQTFLIFNSSGSAHDKLKGAGATGYFGSLTEAALREYQTANGISVTGVYDSATRAVMREA